MQCRYYNPSLGCMNRSVFATNCDYQLDVTECECFRTSEEIKEKGENMKVGEALKVYSKSEAYFKENPTADVVVKGEMLTAICEAARGNADLYQEQANRTNDGMSDDRLDHMMYTTEVDGKYDLGGIINGVMGLCGEAGEFADLIKKYIFHGKELDEEHAKKELGDCCWYLALICESFGWQLSEIMRMNIEKLKARYPEGFSEEASNNRKEGDI